MVDETSHLLFATACRWVRSVHYVYHPEAQIIDGLPGDLMKVLFRDFDRNSGVLELPCFAPQDRLRGVTDGKVQPLRREPPVPLVATPRDRFRETRQFDFAYLSISPRYACQAAEGLMEVFRKYIHFRESAA